MSESIPNKDELRRRILFTALESKDALHDWIMEFLGYDIPDSLVDERSTASPMESIWTVYDRCRRNVDEEWSRVLSYASRMSFKTLGAAILEVLMVLHLGRSVAHMAAIEPQARKSQEYVKKALKRPYIRDFVVGDNARRVDVVRYVHKKTGLVLAPKDWKALPTDLARDEYEEKTNYITIVVCTLQGANSEHVPFMCVDEVDTVANPMAYQEAKAIPDTFEGKVPVTLLTSTRKFSYGLVQDEIDRAHESGLKILHWNIIDVTEPCPKERHLPDEPRIPIYYSEQTLKALSQTEYDDLNEQQQAIYSKKEGFAGCLKKCKMFAACKGRLATHQLSTSNLLKKISQVQSQFKDFTPAMAAAQLLCLKPSTEGLVYPRLDRDVHMLTAAEIANKVTGEEYPSSFSKQDLIQLFRERECRWYGGMDFGFTHNFSVYIGVKDGNRLYVIAGISQAELDIGQMIEVMDAEGFRDFGATIFADPASPDRIKSLRKAGFRIREAPKPAGSVVGGIEIVRQKLQPAFSEPELFFLAGDPVVELLFKHMQQYHWETDASGRITKVPDEENDDEPDALRYMVMNVFAPKGMFKGGKEEQVQSSLTGPSTPTQKVEKAKQQQWNQVMAHIGFPERVAADFTEQGEDPGVTTRRRGSLVWDLG